MLADADMKGGGAAQLPQLYRQLSFVQSSVSQIREVINDGVKVEFRRRFWTAVLTSQAAVEFHTVQNMTIYQWAVVFHRWARARLDGDMKILLDYYQLKSVLGSRWEIVKLFDPVGFKAAENEGRSQVSQKRIRVNILEIMTAGVALSKLISQKHKLQFMYGLFDMDDSGVLDEMQFTTFLKSFYKSLSNVFRIDTSSDPPPNLEETRRIVKSIFGDIDADSSGAISIEELISWSLGQDSEKTPHSLMLKMLLWRFSSDRYGDSPDVFDDGIDKFRLSWNNPKLLVVQCRCPKHGDNLMNCTYLSRQETITAKTFFERITGQSKDFDDAQAFASRSNKEFEDMVAGTIRKMAGQHGEASVDFTFLLRILCPCAQPKHIKMFLNWCDQHDSYIKKYQCLQKMEAAEAAVKADEEKPCIPMDVKDALERQFNALNPGNGLLTVYDFVEKWGWPRENVMEMLERFDVNSDQYIDKHEFMKMMCPPEYSLDTGCVELRDMFAKWLHHEADAYRAAVKNKADEIKHKDKPNVSGLKWYTPAAFLPPVPDGVFYHWLDLFDSIDVDESGHVSIQELRGLLVDEVCYAIDAVMGKNSTKGFTKQKFLKAMCRAHGYREPDAMQKDLLGTDSPTNEEEEDEDSPPVAPDILS